jgi:hypothetical protein
LAFLSQAQKISFKNQACVILRSLLTLIGSPGYIIPDLENLLLKLITPTERSILFPAQSTERVLGFTHNELKPSNIIVMDDEIHYAREAQKTNTTELDTFHSPNRGRAGVMNVGKIEFFSQNTTRHTTKSEFTVDGKTARDLPRGLRRGRPWLPAEQRLHVVRGQACELLGRRLGRRGVSLSAGLLVATARTAGAADPVPVAAVLASAAGSPTARVAELAREVTRSMTHTLFFPLGLAAAVGLAAVLAVVSAGPGPEHAPPPRAVSASGESLPPGAVARVGSGRFRVGESTPAALTPDGRHLVVGQSVLDAATGLEVASIPDHLPDGGTDGWAPISPDGSTAVMFLTKWDGRRGTRFVVLWDIATRTQTRTIAVDWRGGRMTFAMPPPRR